jgi:membrane-anchored glycerophosphoryl diester phosphodiesterase (GDPDase)
LLLFTLATVAGLLLFIIPGLYIATRLVCATTAYLLTGRGVFESLSYSWQLTEGHVWRLSLIFSVYIVLIIVFYLLAGFIATVIAAPFALGDIAMFTAVTAAVTVIVGSIVRPFYTALALAVLGDLSVRKEGTDLAARLSPPG